MGKYMKKSKLTGDVIALVDVSQSTIGVRTRATTLALQKLQALSPSPEHHREFSYLQLRSRKLEKPPLKQLTNFTKQNPNPRLQIRSNNGDFSAQSELLIKFEGETEARCDFGGEEASFGENNLDLDTRERGTRESTPCSFIRESNDSITPGSSTRNRIVPSSFQRIMPSAQEIEEFFARHAQEQHRTFSEKYNFDIVNEKPLQGRYEWVKVQP